VDWRQAVAANPPARYRGEDYWARPVPGFGDPLARLLVVGLAPAANGGNRTGRVFTGDRSGEWLFRALYRAGFANQPSSVGRDDGLKLIDCYITAAVKCAPPGNKPLPDERANCFPFLVREVRALRRARVIVALGGYAWQSALSALKQNGVEVPRPRPVFGHGAVCYLVCDRERYLLIGSYHPSQQNTFTGKLTEAMLDEIFMRAARALTPE
jgi:uracil-DNA glycosylase family 4